MDFDSVEKALIFDIRRFTVHDGPGIRTTVFFKGCPLHCIWCQNPESIDKRAEIIFFEHKCIRCGRCYDACPICREGGIVTRETCLRCGRCAEACMTGARKKAGDPYTPEQLYEEVRKDMEFYKNSGGGVTLSGGEPLIHADFIKAFCRLCVKDGISVAIDTCGSVPWGSFEKVLPYTELFLYDIKAIDPELLKKCTGSGNRLILDNIIRLADMKKNIIVRVPLIPLYTDTVDNIEKIALFIKENLDKKIIKVDLLPYNVLAETKYSRSSIYADGGFGEYKLKGVQTQDGSYLEELKEIFVRNKIPVFLERV